ncbi:MAG: hypothetical protein GY861_13865 [bacterium]|nr:hypothetical protein [bacterium]
MLKTEIEETLYEEMRGELINTIMYENNRVGNPISESTKNIRLDYCSKEDGYSRNLDQMVLRRLLHHCLGQCFKYQENYGYVIK